MDKPKIVLAYSGGLDTSFCIKYLSEEKGFDVYAIHVNVGAYDSLDFEEMKTASKQLGAKYFESIDITQEYYNQCVKYLIFGNVLRNNNYPICVSSERIFQALAIIRYAKSIGATAIAHGSTGAGNDQIRFDLATEILADNIRILTPIRDLKLSRQEEIDYLSKYDFHWNKIKGKYSINKGMWGTTIGGAETLTSHGFLPEQAYPDTLSRTETSIIKLGFEAGEPISLDGVRYNSAVKLIEELNRIGNSYGIGRDTHVGDTILGIKGRVGFEASASLMIIEAHRVLEKHTLTRWQIYWKTQMAEWYGSFVHEGKYLDPVMRDIEVFMANSQSNVSGEVTIELRPYLFRVLGIQSPNDLMNNSFAQYGEMPGQWDGQDVKGFTKVSAIANKIYYSVHQVEKNKWLQ